MQKKNLELSIKVKVDGVIKRCQHEVDYAYFFPFKCEKCSYEYVEYCILNNIKFPQRVEYTSHFPKIIEIINKQKEVQKLKDEEEKIALEKIRVRQEKYKNLVENYGNELAKYISQKNLSPEELGKRYERFVGYLYEQNGYKVEYHGIKMGKEDGGIDIIATAKNHIVLIQCKRRRKDNLIYVNTVKQLLGTLVDYRAEFPAKNVICVLYTQNDNLDEEAKKTLERHSFMKHIVDPYPFDVNKAYPLIKCNIGKNNEKIYHLPTDAMYDRIKIEIRKNECYVDTIAKAEYFGFRRAKK